TQGLHEARNVRGITSQPTSGHHSASVKLMELGTIVRVARLCGAFDQCVIGNSQSPCYPSRQLDSKIEYKRALAPPARLSPLIITSSSTPFSLDLSHRKPSSIRQTSLPFRSKLNIRFFNLECILGTRFAVGMPPHQANGSVLHPRKVDALIGQDKTCGKIGLTRYCNIKRFRTTTTRQVFQEVLPPRKDGTIPAIADCANLNQQEPKDPAGILPKWDLSGCCDATKFDKLDKTPNKKILITEDSWNLGCGIK
ncbi:hypothetical protein MJO28_005419, partial [Puccinia striiformis f. sp. tritici]